MSAKKLEQIIARAVEDEKFRELLLTSPEQALRDYDLSIEERALLKTLVAENFDATAKDLERRISRNRLI